MATPQGRRLGYHTPEQVWNQEPPDSRPCVLTTTLLGGVHTSLHRLSKNFQKLLGLFSTVLQQLLEFLAKFTAPKAARIPQH